jgi:hypothetical protein
MSNPVSWKHRILKRIADLKGREKKYVVNYYMYEGSKFKEYFTIMQDSNLKKIHQTGICFTGVPQAYNSLWASGINGDIIVVGKFPNDNDISKDDIRRYLKECKKYGYINKSFGIERYVNKREYIWKLSNINLQHWYFWLCMIRFVYEQPAVVNGILRLMDEGICLPLALCIITLNIYHNSWHGPYTVSKSRYANEEGKPDGETYWGGTRETITTQWGKPYEKLTIFKGDQADLNKAIRVAIKTKRFLEQDRISCYDKGKIKLPYLVYCAVWEQPCSREEWDFGIDNGDYDSLINLNPYERMM